MLVWLLKRLSRTLRNRNDLNNYVHCDDGDVYFASWFRIKACISLLFGWEVEYIDSETVIICVFDRASHIDGGEWWMEMHIARNGWQHCFVRNWS